MLDCAHVLQKHPAAWYAVKIGTAAQQNRPWFCVWVSLLSLLLGFEECLGLALSVVGLLQALQSSVLFSTDMPMHTYLCGGMCMAACWWLRTGILLLRASMQYCFNLCLCWWKGRLSGAWRGQALLLVPVRCALSKA